MRYQQHQQHLARRTLLLPILSLGLIIFHTPISSQTLTASPNPLILPAGKTVGITTLSWTAPAPYIDDVISIYAGNTLFARFPPGAGGGTAQTGPWAAEGLEFTLYDENTGQQLSTLTTHVIQAPAPPSGAYTPYGLDLELFGCSSPCSIVSQAQSAGAQWVRIFVSWNDAEPNAPAGPAQPDVNGHLSGQHTYNWNYIDTTVAAAVQAGFNVYLQIFWVPAWANGNPYPSCSPFAAGQAGQCIVNGLGVGNPQGYPPTNPDFLEDFAYNLALHLNGTVRYFGPMNEPNLANNYNPEKISDPQGEYLNEYILSYVQPVRDGIKAADPANRLVGPDVSLTSCGVPPKCAGGNDSWLDPLHKYFADYFDVWSVHSYHWLHYLVLLDMLEAHNTLSGVQNLWLTESGFAINDQFFSQDYELKGLYGDNSDNKGWWTRTFYHTLIEPAGISRSADDGLLDSRGNPRPSFKTYQSLPR